MNMKRVFSLLTAAVLALALTGCGSAPASAGRIGEVEIPAGLYLIMQLSAYNEAQSRMADPAGDPLTATITINGEELSGTDYIAAATHEFLSDYAAVRTLYPQLGGVLSEEDKAQAARTADELWSTSGAHFEANGIGRESIGLYTEFAAQRQQMLELLYGAGGPMAVSPAALDDYITQNYRQAKFVGFPLYDLTTYQALDDVGDAQVTELAQQAAERLGAGEDPAALAAELLPPVYTMLGGQFTQEAAAANSGVTVFTPGQIEYYTSPEVREQLLAAKPGDTLVVDVDSQRLALRMEPVAQGEGEDIAALRPGALAEMKTAEMDDYLLEQGDALVWALDEAAVKAYSPKNIVSE